MVVIEGAAINMPHVDGAVINVGVVDGFLLMWPVDIACVDVLSVDRAVQGSF